MRKFGITSETRGSSSVSIPVMSKLPAPDPMFKTGYEFPMGRLVAVRFVPNKKIKRAGAEVETYVVEFLFKDMKDRQYTHIEWPLDPTAKNADKEPEWQDQRVKHIWEETIGADKLPAEGIGTAAQTEAEYFKLIAEAFNAERVAVKNPKFGTEVAEGEDAHPETVQRVAYGQSFVYIKLTYNRAQPQLPLFPNFLQRAVVAGKQVPCENLKYDPKYDILEPSASVSNKPSASADLAGGTLDNQFGGANMDDDDLPDFLKR